MQAFLQDGFVARVRRPPRGRCLRRLGRRPARPAINRCLGRVLTSFALAGGLLAVDLAPLAAAQTAEPAFVPKPQSVTLGTGRLTLGGKVVVTDAPLLPLARVLADEIQTVTGVAMQAAQGTGAAGDIVLKFNLSLRNEAYCLTSTGAVVTVAAGDYASVAAGTATLLQGLTATGGKLSMPVMTIQDQPAFGYRAALMDLGRKYHSPDGIKQVIELCRLYKIRYLQVHISDDQLFMFPSTTFPAAGQSNREFARFEPGSAPHIKPYTLAELKELEAYAQTRGVYIVPELDLPGHSGRLIADVPEAFQAPHNGSTINIASDGVVSNAIILLNEVMDVFQSTPYVHLGADEVGLGGIEQAPEYPEACRKYHVSSVTGPHPRPLRKTRPNHTGRLRTRKNGCRTFSLLRKTSTLPPGIPDSKDKRDGRGPRVKWEMSDY